MKKIKSILFVLLVLSLVLVSIPQIAVVKAQSTIYIKGDGSVEGTDKIQREGNIYTFAGDLFDFIVVEKMMLLLMVQITALMEREAELEFTWKKKLM